MVKQVLKQQDDKSNQQNSKDSQFYRDYYEKTVEINDLISIEPYFEEEFAKLDSIHKQLFVEFFNRTATILAR